MSVSDKTHERTLREVKRLKTELARLREALGRIERHPHECECGYTGTGDEADCNCSKGVARSALDKEAMTDKDERVEQVRESVLRDCNTDRRDEALRALASLEAELTRLRENYEGIIRQHGLDVLDGRTSLKDTLDRLREIEAAAKDRKHYSDNPRTTLHSWSDNEALVAVGGSCGLCDALKGEKP